MFGHREILKGDDFQSFFASSNSEKAIQEQKKIVTEFQQNP